MIEEADHVRADQFAGHAQAADLAGRNRGIGAGAQHAFGKLALGGARHDAHLRETLAHDYGHDQVVFVQRQAGDQAGGAAQSCFFQNVFFGGVADNVEHFLQGAGMQLLQLADIFLGDVHHHVRSIGLLQFGHRMPAGVSQAADNVVAGQLVYVMLHSAPPERLLELHFHHEGGHDRKNINRDRDPEQHNADVEHAQRGIVAGINDFSVAHSGQSDDRHVEGLEKSDGGAAEQAISGGADRDQDQQTGLARAGDVCGGPSRYRRHSSIRFATSPLHPV